MCVRVRVSTRLLFRLMCLNVPGVRTKARPHHLSPPPTHRLSLSVANNNPDCFAHLKRPISSNALMRMLTRRVAANSHSSFPPPPVRKDSTANIMRGSLLISHSDEAKSYNAVFAVAMLGIFLSSFFFNHAQAARRLTSQF